jgi:uncharacterized repeat protein (TIGR02543 family)
VKGERREASDYVFEGWYVDDVKVSSESEYRFLVTDDVILTAKFIKVMILVSDLAYNGALNYDTIDILVEGGFTGNVYVVVNKYDVTDSLLATASTTVSIDSLGAGVWSPVSPTIQMNAPDEYLEIIVYEDGTCEKEYIRLFVYQLVLDFS